jgi:predicted RecA/RadA family phage recombinase
MSEATMEKDASTITVSAPAAGVSGQVVQLPDGRAGYVLGLAPYASGDQIEVQVDKQVKLAKTASVVVLDGDPIYWDRSANTATPLFAVATADFFIGVAVGDAASAATTLVVALNVQPVYAIDIFRDRSTTVLVGTATKPTCTWSPGRVILSADATNEAQKIDVLSDLSIPIAVPFIVEGRMAIFDISAGANPDFNIGIANATHATDADSITESMFIHLDGSSLNILAESDDGTTEVAATDTTVDAVDDTFFDFRFDCRVLTDIQLYINGVNRLPASVFKLDAATGPMKLLAHLEKTSSTDTAVVHVAHLAIRTMDIL